MNIFVDSVIVVGLICAMLFGVPIVYCILARRISKSVECGFWVLMPIAFISAIVVPILYVNSVTNNTVKVDDQAFTEVVMEQEICAVSTSQQFEGEGNIRQVLGTGGGNFVFTSNDVYNYWIVKEDGRKKRESVPVSETEIEDNIDLNKQTPKLVQYHYYRIETYRYKNEEKQTEPLDERYYYVFYVPEGSVVETFDFG